MQMYQQCLTFIQQALAQWSIVDVRTVPNVMYQIRFGRDPNDSSVEYQLNWFIDCTETLIHNHRNSFETLCIEGEYVETSWDVIPDGTDNCTYKLHRQSDGSLNIAQVLPGVLQSIKTRRHFPGNQMHVDTELFHLISPMGGLNGQAVTFLRKRSYSPPPPTYVLSSTTMCIGPVEEIRSATKCEREKIYHKLQEILMQRIEMQQTSVNPTICKSR